MNEPIYIGDSVYYEYNSYSAILTTNNGYGASNTIVLEDTVVWSLLQRLRKDFPTEWANVNNNQF